LTLVGAVVRRHVETVAHLDQIVTTEHAHLRVVTSLDSVTDMAETLYPRRQRCKACRKAFNRTDPVDGGPVVLDGLYCSYRCAGAATPPTDPAKAHRQCALPA